MIKQEAEGTRAPNQRDMKVPRVVTYAVLSIIVGLAFIVSGSLGLRAGSNPDFLYFQVATTVLGLILSIFETLLADAVVDIFAGEDELNKAAIAKGNEYSVEYPHTRLYPFQPGENIFFFFGVWCLNASLICVFWGFTCVLSYPTFGIRTYYHFTVVDILIGYVAPILFMAGLVIIFKVLQLITKYQFKPESIFASMLIFVDYETFNGDAWKTYFKTVKGKKEIHSPGFGAWTIVKFFHYPIVELEDDREEIDAINSGGDVANKVRQKLSGISESKFMRWLNFFNWPSLLLGLIIILNLILAIRVITNATLVKRERYVSSSCDQIANEDLDCFHHQVPHTFIDCSANSSFVGDMVCYRYYSSNEVDALNAFIRAIFLFITFEKFLQLLFSVMHALYKIRYSKVWGLAVLGIGIVMIFVSILCIVFYDQLDTGLIFISVFQFTILSIDVLLVGILLLLNKGYYYNAREDKLMKYYPPKRSNSNTIAMKNGSSESEDSNKAMEQLLDTAADIQLAIITTADTKST